MSKGARKGQRNAHMMAVVALVAVQTAAAVRDAEGEIVQPTSAVSSDATYSKYRPELRREKKNHHLSFNFHVSDGAFVYEPEAASEEYLSGLEPEEIIEYTPYDPADATEGEDLEDADRLEILAMTQGPSDHVEVRSTHTKIIRPSDNVVIVGGQAFEL